jgi:hypothetical protein
MNNHQALSCIALLVSINACADVGTDATDAVPRSELEPTAGAAANATHASAAFSNDPSERALSGECQQSSGVAELWRRQAGADDPLFAVSVKSDALRDVFVATEREGLQKLDASGNVLWVRPFGSLVDVDPSGVVFVVGAFSDHLDLAPGTVLAAAGGTDAYVAKLDQDGAILYAVALGGPADERATSVAAAPDGSVVVSGEGLGTVKLDRAGRTVWKHALFGNVAVDSANDVVVTGALVGTQSFGKDTLTSAGGQDVLVVKMSPDGEYLWSRSYGDAGANQRGEAIAVDGADDVLVGGVVDGAVDFGGGAISVPSGTCPSEVSCKQAGFVLKLGSGGDFVWNRSRAPARAMTGVAADAAGNVYATGSAPGNVPPYRTPLLVGFDGEGHERVLPTNYDMAGVGHAIATDLCGDVVFTFATPGATSEELGRSYVAKLFVP